MRQKLRKVRQKHRLWCPYQNVLKKILIEEKPRHRRPNQIRAAIGPTKRNS